MDASTRPVLEILEITNQAWNAIAPHTFESAWVVTGYFTPEHFDGKVDSWPPIQSVAEATHVLDPCNVLEGTGFIGTPQFCTTMEWQIEEETCG